MHCLHVKKEMILISLLFKRHIATSIYIYLLYRPVFTHDNIFTDIGPGRKVSFCNWVKIDYQSETVVMITNKTFSSFLYKLKTKQTTNIIIL